MSVRFEKNRVFVNAVYEVHRLLSPSPILACLAIYKVTEHRVSIGFQTNNVRLATRSSLFCLVRSDISTFAIVSKRKAGLVAMARKCI
jgi:hypothetical protein